MTTNQPRSFGQRLWWIIRTTLIIFVLAVLVAAVLGGLGYAGYWGVLEIQRSNNSLAMRIDANEQNLNSLRDLVNSEFAQGNPEQQVQINRLENELARLTGQLESLQATQTADTAVQTEQLTTLQADLAAVIAENGDLSEELASVQAALVALQSDLNSSGGRIDELGGDVDRLRVQLNGLDETLTELNEETAVARDRETAELQQSLTLLQLWGVLTNARLALLNDDVTGAETAVTQAQTLVASLTAEPDSAAEVVLERLQTRLDLAAGSFATSLSTAAQDLEAASRELSLLLSGPPAEAEVVEATPDLTETPETTEEGGTAVTPTATPSTTATPQPSPTPAATPTP
ncbi:MAG: hypothetical protein IPM53_24075 [Anaerolineaceae bacterium]|nr:hypothetical protein [Anaerolineaceae bacterium]